MGVAKLANFEQIMQEYRSEVLDFWLKEFTFMGILAAIVGFGGSYLLNKGGVLDMDWCLVAIVYWVGSMILPVKMFYPEKPSPGDILRDQMLRRSESDI